MNKTLKNWNAKRLTAILKMIVGAMTLYKIVQIIYVENPEFEYTSDGF